MAREFARSFYKSKAWKQTRQAYFEYRHGLCERCLSRGIYKPGEIVHHREHIQPWNIDDASVTLSFDNLELLCRDCHAAAHPEIFKKQEPERRVAFDADGNVVRLGIE